MADADLALGGASAGAAVPSSGPVPPPAADAGVMPLLDHLAELRRRIFAALAAVGVGSLVGFAFSSQLLAALKAPYGGAPLLLLGPGDGFLIVLKVAIATGIVLAMPVILFEVWRFVSPGLTDTERRLARPWVPLALVFFGVGVGVAYVVLPFAIAFLSGFGSASTSLQNAWTADGYYGFVATLFVGFGLVMEYPIVLVLLSKVGIVTTAGLRGARRPMVLVFAIVAAVATPGGDIISPFVMGVVLYVLYECSIVLVRLGGH